MKEKALHLLLTGKAKEIAMTIPVKKRAEILNNLIVQSLIDQSLFFEIEKVFDSDTSEEIISELPVMGGGKKRTIKTEKRKIVSKPKPVQPKQPVVKSEPEPKFEEIIKEETKSDSSNLDMGGFFS